MEDAEVIECVRAAAGAPPAAVENARVIPLSGKQGLLVARVLLANGRSWIFKAVKESSQREVCVSALLSEMAPSLVPRVYHAEQDSKRGLYWLVVEDVGTRRLADDPTVDGYVATAVALARLQVTVLNRVSELGDAGVPTVDTSRWEEIALRVLEAIESAQVEDVVWSVTQLAVDTTVCPVTLIHGDLHAGNAALCDSPCDGKSLSPESSVAVRLLDWGSAYIGAAFVGLEELLWPAARHLRTPEHRGRVRAAYLREWAPLLGKPGPLEKAVTACETLVRLELLDEALRRPHQYDGFAVTAIEKRLLESFATWRRL